MFIKIFKRKIFSVSSVSSVVNPTQKNSMEKKPETTEKKFRIKSYGKSELASLYMPEISPKSAASELRKWIGKSPGLTEALSATGLRTKDKRYTPAQAELIVEAIGEPG